MELATARDLLGRHWGTFQAAVNDPEVRAVPGGVQQFVWQSLRNDYLARGEPLPPGSFGAVNALLSLAGAQRRSSLAITRDLAAVDQSGLDRALTADHFTPDIDTRSLDQQPLGLEYRIRFETTFVIDGEPVPQWITWDPGLESPQTISELTAGAEDVAQLLAGDYGVEFGGLTGQFSITTV